MPKRKTLGIFDINSPLIIGMALLSLALLGLNALTHGWVNALLAVRYTAWGDPFMYLRLFTHVLVHANFAHYFGNFLLILVVGPMAEERYGARAVLLALAATALTTGLAHVLLGRTSLLLGASGLAFMLILLASFTNLKACKIPLTVVLVAVFYVGNEVANAQAGASNTSQLSHLLGAGCGAALGIYFNRRHLLKA